MNRLTQIPGQVLAPIRHYLLHEQQKLLKRRDELKKEDPFEDAGRVDDNAEVGQEASEQWGHQRVEALKLEVDKMLIRVRKTLTKIKIGRFGLCENCGRLIDTDRLAINPTAEQCITCENGRNGRKDKSPK
jgi:RNA polymerase-binding transcription factor DksA